MSRGVSIQYGDIAPAAKENFIPTASESEFDTLLQLRQENLKFLNYANPCELYQTPLDGAALPFPSDPDAVNMGLWSEQVSDADGTFSEPIVLTLTSEHQFSSQGLTLTFDTDNNIFANDIKIKWLRVIDGDDPTVTTISEKTFNPTSAFYFCKNLVKNYNKIIITFYSINMPKNRLKLRKIDYGYYAYFGAEELKSVKIIQEINPISSEISINTADFTLDSKSNIEYFFQPRQPLSIYFNDKLKATTFVKTSSRKAKKLWNVQSEDYIGLIDSIPFYGGMYNGKDAYELLEEVFEVAKVPYSINEDLQGILLYGYIPITTCRDALMQIAFAVQNVIDTSDSAVVNVFALDHDIKQVIPKNRILQGQSFTDDSTITGIEITAHTYTPITETTDVYDSSESGTGTNIFVSFSEPLHDLSITNGSIVTASANYAIINANTSCMLTGQKYDHSTQIKRKNNPLVLENEIENIVSVDSATLVSPHNVDNIIEKCYDFLIKSSSVNLKIVEGKHVQYSDDESPNIITYDQPVNVGENIQTETEYLGIVGGRLIKQSFNLNGNIIVKDAELK